MRFSAVLPEFDRVEMRRRANAIDEDQFVLRTVKGAHPSVRLVPDAKIEEVAIDPLAHRGDVIHVPPIHANEVYGAIARDASAGAEGFGKKSPERFVRHLSGRHRELPAPPPCVGVAVDPNIVGRIQEGRIDRSIVPDDLAEEVEVATIAATNAMLATNPDVAVAYAGLDRNGRDYLVVRIALRRQQHIDFARRKPRDRKIEINLEVGKLLKLQFRRSLSQPALSAILLSARRNARLWASSRCGSVIVGAKVEANRLGRQQPALSGDQDAIGIDEQRIGESKLPMEAAISATCFSNAFSRFAAPA